MKYPKKADRFNYAKAQKDLAKYGWKKSAKTKGQKTALKAFWKTKAAYVNHISKDRLVDVITGIKPGLKRNKKGGRQKIAKTSKLVYRFKFQKLSPAQMKLAKQSNVFSQQQFSPMGIFIERPINIAAKDYKVSFHKGSVEITADCRHDEIVGIDAARLAVDPEAAITEAIERRVCTDKKGKQKKIKTFSLMVNGFRSKRSAGSVKAFLWYMKNTLLPDWLSKNEDEENPEGKFADIFHVRLLY